MILVSDYDDCAGPHSIGWQINMAYKHGPITSKSGAPKAVHLVVMVFFFFWMIKNKRF